MIPAGSAIESPDTLREIHAPAIECARLKSMRRLDGHCRRFIEKSPFLGLSTQGHGGAILNSNPHNCSYIPNKSASVSPLRP